MTRLGELTILALVCLCHQGAYANPTTPIDKDPTCKVPSVPTGETAFLTCDFQEDVARNQSVKVKFYGVDKLDNTEGLLIVDCYVNKKEEKYKCDVTQPYSLPDDVSGLRILRHMTLTFTADTNREGSYACLIEPATNLKECVFKLGTKLSTSPSKEDEASSGGDHTGTIIGIVVGVVSLAILISIIAVIAWKVIRKRKPIKEAIKEVFCCCCTSTGRPKPSDSNLQQPPSTPINKDPATSSTNASPNPTGGTPSVEEAQALLKDDQPNTDEFVNSSGQAGGNPYAHIKNDSGIALSVPSSQTTSTVYAAATTPQQGSNMVLGVPPLCSNQNTSEVFRQGLNKLLKLAGTVDSGSFDKDKYSSGIESSNVAPKKKSNIGVGHLHVDMNQGSELSTPSTRFAQVLPLRWPSLNNLPELKVFIKTTLKPLVGCDEFPRQNLEQAQMELQEMKKVKMDIEVKRGHLQKLPNGRQGARSPQLLNEKDSLIEKLETLERVAEMRNDMLQKLIDDMLRCNAQESHVRQEMGRALERMNSTGSDDPAEAETPKTVVRIPPFRRVPDLTVDDLDLNKFEQTSSAEEHPARP